MNRRIWTGVVAGVLAAMVLLAVGIGSYRAGQDSDAVTRVVTDADGDVVRVVGDHHGWGWGPGPGFFLFPLLIILLVVLLARGRGWGGGWHRPSGPHGYGYRGPGGRWGGGDDPEEAFDEWHRRSHERGTSTETASEAHHDAPPPGQPPSPPRDA